MTSETKVAYRAYSLTTYFSRQPHDIKCCPVCGSSLSRSDIAPSKAVVDALAAGAGLIAAHNFSRLYTCEACHWWAVWESLGYYECNSQLDYLIVADTTDGIVDKMKGPASPWNDILQILSVYDCVEGLPDTLGELFVGGERTYLELRSRREIPQDRLFDKFITWIARIRRKGNRRRKAE